MPVSTLQRKIGPMAATFIVMGNIIGIGIFVSSGFVAQHAESPGLFFGVWVVGGFLSLAGAMTLAELGALMPEAGGDYLYLRQAYGPLVGFLSGWASFFITFSGSIAALAVGFTDQVDALFPSLSLKEEIFWSVTGGRLTGLLIILLFSFFNYVGVRVGGCIQNTITAIKVAAFAFLILLGFWKGTGTLEHFIPFWEHEDNASTTAGFGLALIPVIFSYLGWNAVSYMAGEVRDPGRNIPLSILAGTSLTMFIYLFINAVYLYALSLSEMKGVLGVADLASSHLFGPSYAKALSTLIALSILGSLSTTILIAPRIYYAMARDGLFLNAAAAIHPRYGTPAASIVIQGAWSSLLVLAGGFEELLTYVVFVIMLFSSLTVSSVFILRKKLPDRERPYRVWGYPFVPGVFVLLSLGIMLNTVVERPVESLLGLGIVGLGVPVYYGRRR